MLAGIIINLVSSYLKSHLDKKLSNTLSWWRDRSDKRKNDWKLRIKKIASDSSAKEDEKHSEIILRLQSIMLMSISIVDMAFLTFALQFNFKISKFIIIFLLGVFTFTFFLSYLSFIRAAITREALSEANKSTH